MKANEWIFAPLEDVFKTADKTMRGKSWHTQDKWPLYQVKQADLQLLLSSHKRLKAGQKQCWNS